MGKWLKPAFILYQKAVGSIVSACGGCEDVLLDISTYKNQPSKQEAPVRKAEKPTQKQLLLRVEKISLHLILFLRH
ncbi:MAG: hypothetical protein AB1861_12240 [Cyanobacteriota bacterium]